MRPCLSLFLLLSMAIPSCQYRPAVTGSSRNEQNEEPSLDALVGEVRQVCHVIDYDERQEQERQHLIRMGEKIFPAYEAILKDPKADAMEVSGVLSLIGHVNADRSRFLKYTLSRLTDPSSRVRMAAVILLRRIGSPTEASPVIALLSDRDISLVYAAAKTLAAIGGPNELGEMDEWLRSDSQRNDPELREHVQKCRDELKRRLDAKKGSSNDRGVPR